MIDPDLRAIQRKRRQDGRCLLCARKTPRAALCKACRVDWRYCPRCERVHPLAESFQRTDDAGRSTSYCLPCGNIVRNGPRRTRAQYQADSQRQRNARIRRALALYRKGLSYREMAERLGLTRGMLSGLISYARQVGEWPAELQRPKGAPKGQPVRRRAA